MGSPEPDQYSDVHPEPRPGRLRAAISVLRGERLVPLQIHSEWVEYQQAFDALLRRFSALLARQAKAERARAEQLLQDEPVARPVPGQAPKLDLWRKVHGGSPHQPSNQPRETA